MVMEIKCLTLENHRIMFNKISIFLLLFISSCDLNQVSTNPKSVFSEFTNNSNKVFVAAHRARTVENRYPENSLESIQDCIDKGVDIIELDVAVSKDGIPIIMHDSTVDRTTNGTGKIKDMTLNQIKQLKLTHNNLLTEYQIPTLSEVFKLIKEQDVFLDLDFKSTTESALNLVYREIKDHKVQEKIIMFLSDRDKLVAAHRLDSTVQLMPRAYSLEDFRYFVELDIFNVIHIDPSFYDSNVMKKSIDAGLKIWMNALGKYDKLDRLEGAGFDSLFSHYANINIIQTDRAENLIEYLRRNGKN